MTNYGGKAKKKKKPTTINKWARVPNTAQLQFKV